MAMMEKALHDFEARSRLLARLVRTLLAEQTFESLPDLTEELKCRCARLRIRWTPEDITQAYWVIESNTPLPGAPRRRPKLVERELEPAPDLPKAEAARLWAALAASVEKMPFTKAMPAASVAPPRPDDAAENARRNELEAQARQIGQRGRRRPFTDVLDEIFSGRL